MALMMYVPIFIGTALMLIVGTIFSVCPFICWCHKDYGLTRVMAWTCVICMWLMWVATYMSQMWPLTLPEKGSD